VVWRVDLETTEGTPYATGLNVPEGLFFEEDALRVVEWHLPSAAVAFPTGGGDTGTDIGTGYENAYGLVGDGGAVSSSGITLAASSTNTPTARRRSCSRASADRAASPGRSTERCW